MPVLTLLEDTTRELAIRAALTGFYTGLVTDPHAARYMRRCTHRLPGVTLIFTRDIGHHSSGWWKYPDYERCLHLSTSFHDPISKQSLPFNRDRGARWAWAFYGEFLRWCWIEPPYSEHGRAADVYHYRVFCDPGWQPIKPTGEVYSKEKTPAGWRSFTEIHGEDVAARFSPPIMAA